MDLGWLPQLGGFVAFGWFVAALVKPGTPWVKTLFPWVAGFIVAAVVVSWLTHPFPAPPGPGPAIECEVKFEC